MKPQLLGFEAYFIFWLVAAVFGIGSGMQLTRRAGFPALPSFVALCVFAFAILLGSKLLYLVEFSVFPSDDPVPMPQNSLGALLWHGFRIPGGILLLAAAFPLIGWVFHLPTRRFADAAIPAAGMAIFCIRIGCLLNGCCFGAPTAFPLAITFPPGARVYGWQVAHGLIADGAPHSLPVHPLQVYFGLLGLLLYVLGRHWQTTRRFDGEVWAKFFVVFFAGTFLTELLRPTLFRLNLIVTALITAGVGLLIIRARQVSPAVGLSS